MKKILVSTATLLALIVAIASVESPDSNTTATLKTTNPYLSMLRFLGDKVEAKFSTLNNSTEEKLRENLDAVQNRTEALENSLLKRISSVESEFASRVSRMEVRLSSMLQARSSVTGSGVSLFDMARKLQEMEEALDQMNTSRTISQESGNKSDKVNRSVTLYPSRYTLMFLIPCYKLFFSYKM